MAERAPLGNESRLGATPIEKDSKILPVEMTKAWEYDNGTVTVGK